MALIKYARRFETKLAYSRIIVQVMQQFFMTEMQCKSSTNHVHDFSSLSNSIVVISKNINKVISSIIIIV